MTPEERADRLVTAAEAWCEDHLGHPYLAYQGVDGQLAARVALAIREAVAAEREACARVADGFRYPANDVGRLDGRGEDAEAIADAIRARGQS